MNSPHGSLFIVATPIGNLKDITYRAVECLKDVTLVAAEDTRRTRKLLSHLGLQKKIISCNEHNELEKAVQILGYLEQGSSCALVSDAGTPGLSDPGARLVERVRERGVEVIPIPGPSAITAALSVSGFVARTFYFAGFLPPKPGQRRRYLQGLSSMETIMVFFEAPHRLMKSLNDMFSILGDRKVFLAREMTKCHETYISSSISGLINGLEGEEGIKGEITLVVEGSPGGHHPFDQALAKKVLDCLLGRRYVSVKEAVAMLSGLTGLNRSSLYEMALEAKKDL